MQLTLWMMLTQAFRVQLTDLLSIPPANAAAILPSITALLSSWPLAVPRLSHHLQTEAFSADVPALGTTFGEAISPLASHGPSRLDASGLGVHEQLQRLCAAGLHASHAQSGLDTKQSRKSRQQQRSSSTAGVSMAGHCMQEPTYMYAGWMQSTGLKHWAWSAVSLC